MKTSLRVVASERIDVSDIGIRTTSAGRATGFQVDMSHNGLKERARVTAADLDLLESKINKKIQVWDTKWERVEQKREYESKKAEAESRTDACTALLETLERTLEWTLGVDDAVDWSTLKSFESFAELKPKEPALKSLPEKPSESDYLKPAPFFTKLFGGAKKMVERQQEDYRNALQIWEQEVASSEQMNVALKEKYENAVRLWEKQKEGFLKQQEAANRKVDELEASYMAKSRDSVLEYCEMVLNNSEYPDCFPKSFESEYIEDSRMLLVDYELPARSKIPTLKEVKYVKSRDEFQEKFLTSSQADRLYDKVMYQTALRTIHEIFEADKAEAIEAVTFNGRVTEINPATGHEENKCIMSVQVGKVEFEAINLATVEPKACFKALKGVGSAKLSTVTAVRPIIEIDKSDRRIVTHREVVGGLDESTNLAAMDWEDFEHLVREVLEKEFATNGGEVKVTRASADGGVDAIAFDPDPIRGGKIVIQAKRYTNTVGVSAVRDLFGTVISEGATRGILVSTASYGAESYNFAKDKPLTLMDGSNLLHLLEKHGHRAKIDIAAAKKLQQS